MTVAKSPRKVPAMTTRSRDNNVKITREIPLWGLIGAVAAVVLQGILMYVVQEKQAVQMNYQAQNIERLTIEIKSLSAQVSAKDSKDIEQDLKYNELSRRMLTIESRGK